MQTNSGTGPSGGTAWQEIRQLWGDKLVSIPSDLMVLDISDFTRSFLMDVGLPTEGPGDIIFYHDERLFDLLSIGATDYLAVGHDYGTSFGIKRGTDELWAVDPRGELRSRFVNSRLSDFALFLAIYDSQGPDRQQASDEEDEVIVQEMRLQLISRDPRALDDVDNWWSLVLEQMSHGLL